MGYHKTIRAKAWRRADAAKLRAYDSWFNLTREQKREIVDIYEFAIVLEERTGIKHVVDHIIPIRFGGLHVPNNLQVITWEENALKGSTMPTNKDFERNIVQRYCVKLFLTQETRGGWQRHESCI